MVGMSRRSHQHKHQQQLKRKLREINMKVKIALPLYVASLALFSHGTFAEGWGMTATIGQADYEFVVTEGDDYEQAINGDFLSRDIGLDYSWGNHQVAFKVGGLAQEDDVVDSTETEGSANFTEQGDVKRDDFQLSYTYRFDNGVSVIAGYYSSDTSLDYLNTYTNPDFLGNGSMFPFSALGTRQKELENDGYFVGLAYGFSITERMGAYVKGGFQVASLKATLKFDDEYSAPLAGNYTETLDAIRKYESDSTAYTAGFGLFYAINESWVASLNYDIKSFDYDESKFNSVGTQTRNQDGSDPVVGPMDWTASDSAVVKFDENQKTISMSLRYVF